MKRIIITVLLAFSSIIQSYSQESISCTAFLHQTGMYYTSDNVTSDGLGLGIGVHILHKSQVAAQADANILWGNGNAITTRLAIGYERKGTWAPGIYGTFNMIWGQRVQFLSETGEKPAMPAIAAGMRITPLKFHTNYGYISALEFGYGFGHEKGMSLEFSILSVGIHL